jgi:uncharacterized membrane protein
VGLIPFGQAAAATAWSRAGLAVGVIVILVSTAYPLKATEPRLVQRFTVELGSGTLNATDWMRYGLLNNGQDETIFFRGDRAAIAWFNSEVAGSPVIAEASIGAYRGNGSRISIATGLPTVLGWDNHESQQRYSPGIEVRRADVRLLYDSPDPAVKRAIIDSYDIEYIIVGDVERKSLTDGGTERYASPEGLEAFAPMVGTSFEIAFEEEGTTVYQVQSLLSEPQDPAA